MKNNKGFSLVELIVVIAIMAILAAVAIPTFAHFIKNANEASDEQYYADAVYAVELANAEFDVKVDSVEVIVTDGVITIKYEIGEHTITVPKTGAVTCNNAADTAACGHTDCKYGAAAAAIQDIVDFDYKFKSTVYAAGIDADAIAAND